MFAIKIDCVQVPFIYHVKIIGLICDMVDSLDSQSTIIKTKLRKYCLKNSDDIISKDNL